MKSLGEILEGIDNDLLKLEEVDENEDNLEWTDDVDKHVSEASPESKRRNLSFKFFTENKDKED